MRVLLCHNYYRQAGGERAAVEALADLLTDRGHDVLRLHRDNRMVDHFSTLEKMYFPLSTIYASRTVQEVRRLVARERPHVAHVHNIFPLLSPSLYRALANFGVPIIQTLHNFRFLCPNGLFFTHGEICERCKYGNTSHAVRLRCYRGSHALSAIYATSIGLHRKFGTFDLIDRLIAYTPFTAQKMIESGFASPNRLKVLGNFLPSPSNPIPWPEREGHLLFLGRLSMEKGPDLAVAAMRMVTNARMIVAGEGPMMQELARRADSRTQLVGLQVGTDKDRLLRHSAALVAPSRCYEGALPLSILEAFSAGVPVITADHGAMAVVVREGDAGLLHRPGDAEDLGRCLREITATPGLRERLGQNARRLFEERHSADAHYSGLLSIYREVIR